MSNGDTPQLQGVGLLHFLLIILGVKQVNNEIYSPVLLRRRILMEVRKTLPLPNKRIRGFHQIKITSPKTPN